MSVETIDQRTGRIRKAAIVAAGVAAWLLLALIVEKVVGFVAFTVSPGLYGLDFAAYALSDGPYRFGVFILPIAVGLFLAWTFVAPLTSSLDLRTAIIRSAVAAAVAGAVFFIIRVAADLLVATSLDRSLFADSFPDLSYAGPEFPTILISSIQGAIHVLLSVAPLAVLAGILLWHWLRRDAPTREGVV